MSRKRSKSPSRRSARVGKPKRCTACGVGRYEGQGRATEGQPRYACSHCGDTYTRELEAARPPLVAHTTYVEEPHAACGGRDCVECDGSGMWRREVVT